MAAVRHRFTAEEYRKMGEAGIFSKNDRVALEKSANGLLRERPEPNLASAPGFPRANRSPDLARLEHEAGENGTGRNLLVREFSHRLPGLVDVDALACQV